MPVPARLRDSAPTAMPPWSSTAAPLVTVTPPAVVPVAVEFWRLSTPAETAVAPVYVLAPARVQVPVRGLVPSHSRTMQA